MSISSRSSSEPENRPRGHDRRHEPTLSVRGRRAGSGESVTGFQEAGLLPHWVSCGVYVLGEEALPCFPTGGTGVDDLPEVAGRGGLGAFPHAGVWLTVNTPKELRLADEHLRAHPDWLDSRAPLGYDRPVGDLTPTCWISTVSRCPWSGSRSPGATRSSTRRRTGTSARCSSFARASSSASSSTAARTRSSTSLGPHRAGGGGAGPRRTSR